MSDLDELNAITGRIIHCAMEVHQALGPGLLEAAYETALSIELEAARIPYVRQHSVPVFYKGRKAGDYRIDLLVEDSVVVEIKAVERVDPLFDAQVLAYLRASGKRLGLLLNFNTQLLKSGIRRLIL
jgi:GxxExxY protein